MAFSESIYLLIIFTLPAAMHIIYNTYIRNSPRIQKDKSIELAENIFFCLIVFVASVAIFREHIKDFAEYIIMSDKEKTSYLLSHPSFSYWGYLINYAIITFIVSMAVIIFWYSTGKKIFHLVINIINKIFKRPMELESSEIWRSLFETDKLIHKFNCCIVIEKSGNMITAGLLHSFQPPHLDGKELLLYNTEQIKEVLKEDALKPPEDRIFYPALYEYYDVNADMLMKFYAIDKLKEVWYPQSKT